MATGTEPTSTSTTSTGSPFGGFFGAPQTIPGYQPNYAGLIQTDPGYQQTLADLAAGGISDQSQADVLTQRALVQFGEVPALEGLDAKLAGPEFARNAGVARPLAEANTASGMSVTARMEKMRKDNVRAIKNALASRNALRSGETGYQLGEEQQRYSTAQFDARTQLVDFLSGIQAGLAGARRQQAGQRTQAVEGAYGRAVSNPANQPEEPFEIFPSHVPGMFFKEDGTVVGPDGTPASIPSASDYSKASGVTWKSERPLTAADFNPRTGMPVGKRPTGIQA